MVGPDPSSCTCSVSLPTSDSWPGAAAGTGLRACMRVHARLCVCTRVMHMQVQYVFAHTWNRPVHVCVCAPMWCACVHVCACVWCACMCSTCRMHLGFWDGSARVVVCAWSVPRAHVAPGMSPCPVEQLHLLEVRTSWDHTGRRPVSRLWNHDFRWVDAVGHAPEKPPEGSCCPAPNGACHPEATPATGVVTREPTRPALLSAKLPTTARDAAWTACAPSCSPLLPLCPLPPGVWAAHRVTWMGAPALRARDPDTGPRGGLSRTAQATRGQHGRAGGAVGGAVLTVCRDLVGRVQPGVSAGGRAHVQVE